ncbi:MAG TPA: hypothetical protein VK864_09030, partial [Longimicrobiales bacterium]|nr:hypothetical protein [Longimicrobiales bacterium]
GSLDITFNWVPADFLKQQQVRAWSDLPVWMAPGAGNDNWGRVSVARAVAKGLTYRSLAETTRATLDWHATRPAEAQANMRAGLKPDREAAVLAAWRAAPKAQ